jgi:phosphoglycerate kinase
MNKITINDLNLEGKCVLTRVDFNVPLSPDGRVSDDTRMRASLPSINMILEKGASLVLMSHLGRPKGSVVPEMSLRPVAEHLSELLGRDVFFASDCVSEEAYQKRSRLLAGEVMLLENLRFHKAETDNDAGFAERLAKLGDVYVNDAFGTAHRAHASTEGVTKFFDLSAAGLLMEKEINYLSNAIEKPTRPLMAILGGAKVSGKMDVIQNLLPKVDVLLIGGGMAFTFLKAQGHEIGRSILEEDRVEMAGELLAHARESSFNLALPVDTLITDSVEEPTASRFVDVDKIEPGMIGVDIGPETIRQFAGRLSDAKTVIWNGPMGIFEKAEFARGTMEMAKTLADLTREGTITIIGGGDSVAAVNQAGLEESITHISTGGGASLELLSGYRLPGLEALTDKRN